MSTISPVFAIFGKSKNVSNEIPTKYDLLPESVLRVKIGSLLFAKVLTDEMKIKNC